MDPVNVSRAFETAGLGPACYAVVADVVHPSAGDMGDAYGEAATRFGTRYAAPAPMQVS